MYIWWSYMCKQTGNSRTMYKQDISPAHQIDCAFSSSNRLRHVPTSLLPLNHVIEIIEWEGHGCIRSTDLFRLMKHLKHKTSNSGTLWGTVNWRALLHSASTANKLSTGVFGTSKESSTNDEAVGNNNRDIFGIWLHIAKVLPLLLCPFWSIWPRVLDVPPRIFMGVSVVLTGGNSHKIHSTESPLPPSCKCSNCEQSKATNPIGIFVLIETEESREASKSGIIKRHNLEAVIRRQMECW